MTYRVNSGTTRWQIVDDEAVVVHVETSYYYGLNRVGTRVWTALTDAPMTEAALATLIATEYGIDERTALADIRPLLADLVRESLIVEV